MSDENDLDNPKCGPIDRERAEYHLRQLVDESSNADWRCDELHRYIADLHDDIGRLRWYDNEMRTVCRTAAALVREQFHGMENDTRKNKLLAVVVGLEAVGKEATSGT